MICSVVLLEAHDDPVYISLFCDYQVHHGVCNRFSLFTVLILTAITCDVCSAKKIICKSVQQQLQYCN
jgi:hypothetical protein